MEFGARLLRAVPTLPPPKALLVEWRCTDGKPMSARLVPDDDRWKTGCAGRPPASDILEPDCERACVFRCTELERFMADDGIGIAETLLLTEPRVCAAH
jgi:hypothetical protein